MDGILTDEYRVRESCAMIPVRTFVFTRSNLEGLGYMKTGGEILYSLAVLEIDVKMHGGVVGLV